MTAPDPGGVSPPPVAPGPGLFARLTGHAALAKRAAQAVAGTGLILSAAGFYLQTRSLRSEVATLQVQAEQLEIDKKRAEREEEAAVLAREAAERDKEAAQRERESAERDRESAERQRRDAELERAGRLFSLADSVCTLSNPAEINSRLKLLGQISADENIDSRFCLSYRGGESFSGAFALPVVASATLTSPFGLRRNPILGLTAMHAGVDWQSPDDETVLAPADGLVTYAGANEGYGNHIVLDHGNGWRTTYSHLDAIACTVGDIVLAGQKIGQIGATGYTTGRHLHFEVLLRGDPVDPEKYLTGSAN